MCDMSRVLCHVSGVRCHMSGVMCHIFFFTKVVERVGRGPNPSYSLEIKDILFNSKIFLGGISVLLKIWN